MSGLVIGGFTGVIRSSTPFLFALASGFQWSVLGGTFWGMFCALPSCVLLANILNSASRGAVLHAWGKDKVTPKEKISANAIAGGVGGTVGGLLR